MGDIERISNYKMTDSFNQSLQHNTLGLYQAARV